MTNRPRPIPPTRSHYVVATLADPEEVGVRGLHPLSLLNKILDSPLCYVNKQASN